MKLAHLDLPEGNAMRAPGEAPGLMVLEVAMDEMAEKLGMDPVEFRIRNDTQVDPSDPKRPFSHRDLVGCLKLGAEKFGWSKRNAKPGQVRDGQWLVGHGMAAAFRNNMVMKSGARVRLAADGTVTVETDMTDIGTGSYTIIAQTAAEMMGVPLDRVVVRLGDSAFRSPRARRAVRRQLLDGRRLRGLRESCGGRGATPRHQLGRRRVRRRAGAGGNRAVPLGQAASGGEVSAEDTIEFGDISKKQQQSTFGAHFVEVGVDAYTGETRVRRMLAVCAAGRILNPKSARSQVIGGMTMGTGRR